MEFEDWLNKREIPKETIKEVFVDEFINSNNYMTKIYMNPTQSELHDLTYFDPQIRGFTTQNSDLYIWSGEAANHIDIARHLKVNIRHAFQMEYKYEQDGFQVWDTGFSGEVKNGVQDLFQSEKFQRMFTPLELQTSKQLSNFIEPRKPVYDRPERLAMPNWVPGRKSWASTSENFKSFLDQETKASRL